MVLVLFLKRKATCSGFKKIFSQNITAKPKLVNQHVHFCHILLMSAQMCACYCHLSFFLLHDMEPYDTAPIAFVHPSYQTMWTRNRNRENWSLLFWTVAEASVVLSSSYIERLVSQFLNYLWCLWITCDACYHACFMICCKGTNWSLLLLIRDGGKQPPPLCDTAVRVGCFRVLHYHTWDFSIIHDAGI